MRFSWENDILMRFSHELFYCWESHFSHERWKLMRVSWDSHEKTLSRKLCFCFFSWLYRVFPRSGNTYWECGFMSFLDLTPPSHAKVNIRCMHVVLVKENHFEVLSSSKLNMFTWVETRLCVLVHVRLLVTWQRTNSVTIDRVTAFDHEAIVRIRTIVIRSFCGLRLRSFQVRF